MSDNFKINLAKTESQMRKGTLEFCILLVISRGQAYASDILKELKKANLIVVEGTIYPLLTRLKNLDLLAYDWEESKSGPPRKYYSLTEQGNKFLAELVKVWEDLDASVLALIKKKNNFIK